ncbi:MAG: phosphotransferase [Candidatus Saccharibacteria bacterium]|nr:phosphotransferase [Candidatus Saccharibacteria bacterium]
MDKTITPYAQAIAARQLGTPPELLRMEAVTGGYSLNRRSLVGVDNRWLFVKEVDTTLLSGDGSEELSWLNKDAKVMSWLRRRSVSCAPGWSELGGDGRILLMEALRAEEGWHWTPPQGVDISRRYVDAVVNAIQSLEDTPVSEEEVAVYQLQPFFRNEMADDSGFGVLLGDAAVRRALREKFTIMARSELPDIVRRACDMVVGLLSNMPDLHDLQQAALSLKHQPDNLLNHCDVRSDNVAWHESTGRVVLVDWNWASLAPRGFGATEFLMDIVRRGGDATPWLGELNKDLLAAAVGMYITKCLQSSVGLSDGLRQMQAETAAVALLLYRAID